MAAPRPSQLARRAAAWYVTGPVGHLVAGTLDIGELLLRYAWVRTRQRALRAGHQRRALRARAR